MKLSRVEERSYENSIIANPTLNADGRVSSLSLFSHLGSQLVASLSLNGGRKSAGEIRARGRAESERGLHEKNVN